MSSIGSSSSITDKIETSIIVDLLTLGVLSYLAYFLYSEIPDIERPNIFAVPDDPHILALQLTIFLIIIYSIETLHDRVRSSH